ncbi:unnamed protein product [[Actinomadura] parvosata subsp. kistnae]|nr:unnamed protein product [Actinomadura parvosata subsp. kistnae]
MVAVGFGATAALAATGSTVVADGPAGSHAIVITDPPGPDQGPKAS